MGSAQLSLLDIKLKNEREYWLRKLSGDLVVSGLPLDYRRPEEFVAAKDAVHFSFEQGAESRLNEICQNKETLAFTVFVTALGICLHKYANHEDVIVGAVIHEQYGDVASLNQTLALRNEVKGSMTVRQLIENIRRTLFEAYQNQRYPFKRIIELLEIEYPVNRAPLFNVVVMLDSINNKRNAEHLRNDVTLSLSRKEGGASGVIEFNTSLFQRQTVELFAEHYVKIVHEIIDNPARPISDLELLSQDEKHEVVFEFNRTGKDYPKTRAIHQLFEEQAAKTPGNLAVAFNAQRLTYHELNSLANQLAHRLRKMGVGPGVMVGLFMDHSFEAVIGALGVLKAGGAFVPLDPAHPKARLSFVLEDAAIEIVVTQSHLARKLPGSDLSIVHPDSSRNALEDDRNPEGGAGPEDLAYVIYTSGSTGEPKGVMIHHSALVNYTWWAKDVYLRGEKLAFPFYSSLAFDLTVTSIFTPLVTGNEIVVYAWEGREPPLVKILNDNQTDALKLTPSHLSLIKDRDNSASRIKRLIVGGEAFETKLARQVYDSFGGKVEIFNEYGPTEATVGCMIYEFDPEKDTRAFVPIGRPADNAQIYILDHRLNPVANNMIGEIYISGDGLAHGYLNRPGLTAERFIENPFLPGQEMYKTGDLARRLHDGRLEFLGRADDQIKFHGYWVELNEIKCALNQHPQVRNSVVLVTKDRNNNDVMVAYYVSRRELENEELRSFLAQSIFEETIPNVFVHLKRLPLTLNGKPDMRALPTLDEVRKRMRRTFVAPRNETESALAGIWSDVLAIDRVGIYDHFFDLGGHSLMATQIISRVRDAFQVELPLRVFFESPTIADLAASVERISAERRIMDVPRIESVSRGNRTIDELITSPINPQR